MNYFISYQEITYIVTIYRYPGYLDPLNDILIYDYLYPLVPRLIWNLSLHIEIPLDTSYYRDYLYYISYQLPYTID